MTRAVQRPLPLVAGTGVTSDVTGLPGTTLRRLAKDDPSFPQPFIINDRGDLKWPLREVIDWLEVKAGRRLLTIDPGTA
jgi:hypothetical protein